MPDQPWYQNGWKVLGAGLLLIFFGIPVSEFVYEEWRKYRETMDVVPEIAGEIYEPLFGSPSFEFAVWHHCSDDLKNGLLMVTAEGAMVDDPENSVTESYSFERWKPNRENAVDISFPLSQFDPEEEIALTIFLSGDNAEMYLANATWLGGKWKKFDRLE